MIPYSHCPDPPLEYNAERFVIVPNEYFWRAVPRKRFGDLTRQPLGRRIFGDRDPNYLASTMHPGHECIDPLEANSR